MTTRNILICVGYDCVEQALNKYIILLQSRLCLKIL